MPAAARRPPTGEASASGRSPAIGSGCNPPKKYARFACFVSQIRIVTGAAVPYNDRRTMWNTKEARLRDELY
jgi:hypothetical protein